jgi:DNA anti-recombination protein RmuC
METLKGNFKQALESQQRDLATRLDQLKDGTISQTKTTLDESKNQLVTSKDRVTESIDQMLQETDSTLITHTDQEVGVVNKHLTSNEELIETLTGNKETLSAKVEEIKNTIDIKGLTSELRDGMQMRERRIKNSENIIKDLEKLLRDLQKT